MREIIIDTETTGLDPISGDRIIELAALELINGSLSEAKFHQYINPERDVPDSAVKVHGISWKMVEDKPRFFEVANDFLDFIQNDQLVAHNAEFDLRFINCELNRAGFAALSNDRVVDTLSLARKKHPGSSNSLDALCTRYGIDRSRRIKHGALVDAQILAEVYIELSGGRQSLLSLELIKEARNVVNKNLLVERLVSTRSLFHAGFDESECEKIIDLLGSNAIWARYLPTMTSLEVVKKTSTAAERQP